LVPDVFVRREQHVETSLLGSFDQFAVGEFFPSSRSRFFHRMSP
jgi:hypothetical protein